HRRTDVARWRSRSAQRRRRQHQALARHERGWCDELRRRGERRDTREKDEAEEKEDTDERELLPHRRRVERLGARPVLGRLVFITRSHLSDQRSNAALSATHGAAHEGALVRRQK